MGLCTYIMLHKYNTLGGTHMHAWFKNCDLKSYKWKKDMMCYIAKLLTVILLSDSVPWEHNERQHKLVCNLPTCMYKEKL